MNNVTSIKSSQRSVEHNINRKGKGQINSCQLPPRQGTFTSIQPDLNSMKKEFFLKNSLLEHKVSEESCETLQKIMQSTQKGGNFSLLQNIIHYLHSQSLLLKNSLRIGDMQNAFKTFQNAFYHASYQICLYPVLNGLNSNFVEEDGESAVTKTLNKLLEYERLMEKEISSDKYKEYVINSFQKRIKGDYQKRYETIRDESLRPLEEIRKAAECVKELYSKIPKNDYATIFWDERADTKNCYVKEEFISFRESLVSILDALNIDNELIGVFTKKDFSDLLDLLVKLNEIKNPSGSAVLDLLFSLSNVYNRIEKITDESFNTSPFRLNEHSPLNNIIEFSLDSVAFNLTFRHFLLPFIQVSTEDILKNHEFQIAQIPSINLNVIWKKLSLSREENSPKLVSILMKTFFDEISVLSMSKESSIKVDKCLNKINEIITSASKNELFLCLEAFVQSDPKSIYALGKLKENVHALKDDINLFGKLMKECNEVLQKELDTSNLSEEMSQLLEQRILSFKADISQILSPILKLPTVLDSLIIDGKRTKISKKEATYQPDLEDDIWQLLNIKFKKYPKKEEIEIKEPLPIQIEKDKKFTPKSQVITPVKKQNVKALIKENDRPMTTRRANILAYLDEKGWKQASMTGSHLKLKKENESLIIPCHKSKDHLPRGTLGAIFRQLDKKEEKIASK